MQYVYRNTTDTVRISVHPEYDEESGKLTGWSFHAWTDSHTLVEYSDEAGDVIKTKREALEILRRRYGKLVSLPASRYPQITSYWSR